MHITASSVGLVTTPVVIAFKQSPKNMHAKSACKQCMQTVHANQAPQNMHANSACKQCMQTTQNMETQQQNEHMHASKHTQVSCLCLLPLG